MTASSAQQRVVAVGIDAAEPTLIRRLIDDGELPTLGSLLDRGAWALIDGRAELTSGVVWPTFFTGTDPAEHQMYQSMPWHPDRMACASIDDRFFAAPFWRPLTDNGRAVGILDVPWAPLVGMTRGFEISEWGPHEGGHRGPRLAPSAAARIVAGGERHPFQTLPYGPGQADDREGKERLSSASVAGARVRGDLAVNLISETRPALSVITFSEVHHAAHHLWQTVEPDHPLYATGDSPEDVRPSLLDLFREIDRQVGRIAEAAGPDTAIMVFSLHGMKPGPGIPTVLEPLLEALGFAAPAGWRELSWRGRGAMLFRAAKRRAPASLRGLYYRRTSFRVRSRMAQPTIVNPYDWSRTRAFTLPSDQRGYIRINLAGREAKGIVPPRDYDAMCEELTDALEAAESATGEPLVERLVRPAAEGAGPPRHMPDLIVDWAPAGFARPVRVASGSMEFEAHPIRPEMTGQHAPLGFCILDERLADGSDGELLAGRDLHRVLLSAVGAVPARSPG